MCGIAGILSKNFGGFSVTDLERMTNILNHRGPDGQRVWMNEKCNVGLGHRRLSIIDLSNEGSQPMAFANGRYTITYNGEIYNYIELKKELKSKGYTFRSQTDTEVLLALYDLKKEKCLEDLDGMFAFAIWDEQEQQLFCARDRFGEKPFYYSFTNDRFSFASEMKALWALGIDRSFSHEMFFNFLSFSYSYDPTDPTRTFYSNIKKLQAGHYLIIKKDLSYQTKKYWNLNYSEFNHKLNLEDSVEKFKELFFDSVSKRLRSDVPIGSSLSGGLDSSAIVTTINKFSRGEKSTQKTFSARFPNYEKDEGEFIEHVLQCLPEVTGYSTYPDQEKLLTEIDNLIYHQEEPFGTASIFAQYEVMKLARENNTKVLLDGQGADEVLAGYHHYFRNHFQDLISSSFPSYVEEQKRYAQIHGETFQTNSVFYLKAFLPELSQKVRKFRLLHLNNLEYFNDNYFNLNKSKTIVETITCRRSLTETMYSNVNDGGLEDLLRFLDRNSMAFSREARLPFLSHKLVEFSFSLPNHLKVDGGWTKYLMRVALKDLMPDKITWRKDKIGYETPQYTWMKNQKLQTEIMAVVDQMVSHGILHKSLLKKGNNLFGNLKDANFMWNCWIAGKILFSRN
jgi:asparagine synthase (glutamine-hydrolysing)